MATKKANKNVNVNFSKSIETIKNTSESVVTQLRKGATVVADDIWKNGEKLTDVATQKVRSAIANVDLNKGVKKVQELTKEANDLTLETAEELVDNSLKMGEKWHNVATKAVRGGLKLAEKQQDLAFESLAIVRDQFKKSVTHFSKLRK